MTSKPLCLSLAIAAAIAVVVPGLRHSVISAAVTTADQRLVAPDFALDDSHGTRVNLSAYKGRVVLLDFWATWCTGCKVEIPWFIEFQTKYKDRGLTAIGAAMDEEGLTLVTPYLAEHPINYPIVLGYPALMEPYHITALPVTLLIDRAGRIADAHAGIVDKDVWEQEIRALLGESTPRR
jgi:cytochrome c biogenesis protein CcmG/thiol:disulfide interchange protein DsbE